MRKAMRQAWGVPLLGCVPDRAFLGCPALADLETLFKTKLISGGEHRYVRCLAFEFWFLVSESLGSHF